MFWYFIVAGVNYLAYYVVNQVCNNQEEIIGNTLSIAGGNINIPSANISVVVSEKINLLLRCSGDDTLINIFEFNFLVDDLTGQIEHEVESLSDQTAQLNQTEEYHRGLDSLLAMENSSINLDFLKNASLPTVHEQLRNISTGLNATINNPDYFTSLAAVNNITTDLLLTNGTTIHEYYDQTNITSLNCTEGPYSKMNQPDQQDLCAKAAVAIDLTIIRNLAILHESAVYSNVTDVQNKLTGFEEALPTIHEYQNETQQYANSIRGYLDIAFAQATAIIYQVQGAANEILALIFTSVTELTDDTKCAFLGTAYLKLSHSVCSDVGNSLEVIAAMMLVGAVMLFVTAIVSVKTSHKIERDFVKHS